MFGNPISTLMSSATTTSQASEGSLKLFEQILDYIRSNLANIQKTWGPESAQYKSALGIMNGFLEENAKRLKVEKPDLEDLMKSMKLDD